MFNSLCRSLWIVSYGPLTHLDSTEDIAPFKLFKSSNMNLKNDDDNEILQIVAN